MKKLLAFFLFIASGQAFSSAITIDFDDQTCLSFPCANTYLTEDTIYFLGNFLLQDSGSPENPDNDSQYLQVLPGGSITFGSENLMPFDLFSIDLAEFNTLSGSSSVEIVGSVRNGGFVNQVFTLDNIIDGSGGLADFQTFVFDADFVNLEYAYISTNLRGASYSIDNISLRQLPLPASAWLLVSGVLGLTGIGFKRKR